MTARRRPTSGVAIGSATLAALLATVLALLLSGRTLPFPGSLAPSALAAWVERVGPTTAAFTGARALAMALVGWLAGTWALAVAVRVVRHPGAVRAADGVTLPFVRRLADLAVGATLVAATFVPASQAGAVTTPTAVIMRDLGPVSAPSSSVGSTTTATVVVVEPAATVADPGGADEPTTEGAVVLLPEPTATGRTWRIAPGDTLWHVAEANATDHLGRPASDDEVATELDRLVALNADRLAVPGEPGLVFPGQEFLLP